MPARSSPRGLAVSCSAPEHPADHRGSAAKILGALRVAFDAGLLALIALDSDALHDRTQELDEALQSLGLQPANRAGPPWAERQRGALKLLRNQAVVLVAQVLPTLAVILASP